MKVLLFKIRGLCYNSSNIFIDELYNSFEKLGVNTEICCVDNIEEESSVLEKYIGKTYDAVIDINSVLPAASYEDIPYPDLINAPFINLIVDHPMHLHPLLNISLKNNYVVCLDEMHKEYISKYYPNIKNVLVMPLGASKAAETIDFDERQYNILFPATYTPLAYFREQLDSMGDDYLSIADRILDMIEHGAKPDIPALFTLTTGTDNDFFALKMYKARYIDRYIREVHRQTILDKLLSMGLKIDALGHRWDMYDNKYKNNLNIHPACSYLDALNMIGNSKVVLNVQPLFITAPHDRIFNSMINGAVSLTNSADYLDKSYKPGQDYLLYDLYEPSLSIDRLFDTLNDCNCLKDISGSAYQNVYQNDTWNCRALTLYNFINTL